MLLPIILAALGTILLFVLLALFSRGGRAENIHRPARAVSAEELAQFPQRVRQLILQQGMIVERTDFTPRGSVDLLARDPRPLFGFQLYVRIFGQSGGEPVGAAEVQAAADRLKEGFHKAALISWNGFTDEARAAADGSAVELLDGELLLHWVQQDEASPLASNAPAMPSEASHA